MATISHTASPEMSLWGSLLALPLTWRAKPSLPVRAACKGLNDSLLPKRKGDLRAFCYSGLVYKSREFLAVPTFGTITHQSRSRSCPGFPGAEILPAQNPLRHSGLRFKLQLLACPVGCAKLRNTPGKSRQSTAEQEETGINPSQGTCSARSPG